MKLPSTTFTALAFCTMNVYAVFPAYGGNGEYAMETSLHQLHLDDKSAEWQSA